MRKTNPLARIPSLALEDGEVLIDSAAILDWLDEAVGPARALLMRSGPARRRALQRMALAAGAVDKAGASAYERIIRPAAYRWPEWVERCRTQARGALDALSALDWPEAAPLDQAQITTACMLRYLQMNDRELRQEGRYPALDVLARRCEARPEFQATYPPDIV